MTKLRAVWPWYAAAGGLIVLDQATKAAVRHSFALHESIPILGHDFLRLTYVLNPGIAFGVSYFGLPLLLVFGWGASIAISIYLYRLVRQNDPLRWPMTLFLAGALGNSIDRLVFGRVTDFLDFDFPDLIMERWPVFNVADSCVTVGIVLLALLVIFAGKQPTHQEVNDQSSPQAGSVPTDHGTGTTASTD
jgi:signal peptidase II